MRNNIFSHFKMPKSLNTFILPSFLCLIFITLNTQASGSMFDANDSEKWPQVSNLGNADNRYLIKQVELIDNLSRQRLGTLVRGNFGDIELLQRIVYRGLIKRDNRQELQAMGVVLGNLMIQEKGLIWQVYEDEHGRSRAVCVAKTDQCLFPVTMLSRRMQVGLIVNVQQVYDNAMSLIRPYLPKQPYGG